MINSYLYEFSNRIILYAKNKVLLVLLAVWGLTGISSISVLGVENMWIAVDNSGANTAKNYQSSLDKLM